MKTVLARIVGRVQGVWYRGWTVERAREHGLSGWVRNRSDGTVEALFHGEDGAVDQMLTDCRRGPSAARVDNIVTETHAPPRGETFTQLATL
ncbi:MAG: acylphosphatase [Rhodospirillum sp.]|nr:acylphosphatase [Rhodospirillum sp.]MCF8488074.1 acylphosphatase [Rhodospirillum sp.]MCF8499870.1 acylphosphatase [Rhodospirillum sp.]